MLIRSTTSITPNVTRYCVSLTANVRWGATKKKSNAATESAAASTDGHWPKRAAANATSSRYTMMTLLLSKRPCIVQATAVESRTTPADPA